ncbi:MAG: acyltransferase [Lachnospiraceae bacterium]|nr:acyltransferase [Lachnospiraceae bacterium]
MSGKPAAESGESNRRISLLRVIAALGIVLLHTANVSEILYREDITRAQDGFAMGIVYCMMWAVPCFLMVSGSLLLDPAREITWEKILKKYVKRIGLALLICCILFRLFDILMNGEGFSVLFLADAVYELFTGTSWAHLWYLYLLIGLYLLLPFYRMITEHASDRDLKILLALYLVFQSILPLTALAEVPCAFEIQTASIYPFYFFAGHIILSGRLVITRRNAVLMAALSTIGIIGLSFAGAVALPDQTILGGILGSYASPLVAVQTVGIFVLLCCEHTKEVSAATANAAKAEDVEKTAEAQPPVKKAMPAFLTETMQLLDECGFGIYLLHMLFLRLFLRYLHWDPFTMGEWTLFAIAIGVFLLSAVVVALLRKIPRVSEVL